MSRLIDADKLHYSRIRIAHSDGIIGGYNAVVMSAEIKDAPTVDAVEVVRCSECILHDSCSTEDVFKFARLNDDRRFCGVGKRKGGDE